MSHVSADNLKSKTLGNETPMIYPVRGSAKGWANFNGQGTVAIRDSLNVSSLTDNGTGDYSVNLTNVMTNANFAYVMQASVYSILNTPSASALNARCYYPPGSPGTAFDPSVICAEALGDLA